MGINLRTTARLEVAEPVAAAPSSDRRLALLATIGIPLALLGIAWATTPHTELQNGLETDGIFYLAMAKRGLVNGVLSHSAPMAFRVLTPFLAGLLPFTKLAGFSVLGFVSNWATLALLYAVLRRSGISQRGSIVGMLLYSGVFWSLKYSFFSPALVDFQTQLFLVGICYLILRKWWWAIGPVIALGVAQKESILAMAVVAGTYYVMTEPTSMRRRIVMLASFVVPGVIVYAGLRMAITPLKSYPSGVGLMVNQVRFWANPTRWPVLLLCVFSGLGILPLLTLIVRSDIARRVKQDLHWIVMTGIGFVLLLGGLAKSRLFLYMLPAVVVLVAGALDRRMRDADSGAWTWLGVVLLLHFALGNWLMRVGNYETYLRHLNPEFSAHLGAEPYVRTAALVIAGSAFVLALHRSTADAR